MFEPAALFASPKYENASAAVLFCKEFLEKSGHINEARKLEGIDAVTSAPLARVTFRVLRDMRLSTAAQEYVEIAKDLLREALADEPTPAPRVAA